MQVQLEALVETITMNIGYPIPMQNLSILLEYSFYFDICAIIFPEINIKIIKIGQDQQIGPDLRIQKLLELLTEELQINLAALSGKEILKGNSMHIYQLLNVLKEFSELPPSRPSLSSERFRRRVYSCPFLHLLEKNTKQPQSARDYCRERNLSNEGESQLSQKLQQPQQVAQIQKQPAQKQKEQPQKRPTEPQNQQQKKSKSTKKKGKNKTSKKILKPTQPRNSLNSGPNTKKMNKKYQCFLQKLMKRNKNKQPIVRVTRSKTAQQGRGDWRKEVKEVDDFFRSFELKLRDKKAEYLQRMQKLIRSQQNERLQLSHKQSTQKTKSSLAHEHQILHSLTCAHKHKKQLLHDRSQSNKQIIQLLKKQQQQHLRTRQRQLKLRKQQELRAMLDCVVGLNQRLFRKFQCGGQLERIVFDMYRRM